MCVLCSTPHHEILQRFVKISEIIKIDNSLRFNIVAEAFPFAILFIYIFFYLFRSGTIIFIISNSSISIILLRDSTSLTAIYFQSVTHNHSHDCTILHLAIII